MVNGAGIPVPDWRLEDVAGRPVLVLGRFDRKDGRRIPFLSAMSMLDARDHEPRILETAIDLEDTTASLDLALSVADYFELSGDEARAIAAEVGQAVSGWRAEASALGLRSAEIQRMTSAFEHEDLSAATA
jgi:hypothetical protein